METLGSKRVVLEYTSLSDSQKESIKTVKTEFAEYIDKVERIKDKDHRLAAMVQTKLEDACMYYVKLIAS